LAFKFLRDIIIYHSRRMQETTKDLHFRVVPKPRIDILSYLEISEI